MVILENSLVNVEFFVRFMYFLSDILAARFLMLQVAA